MRAIEMQAMLRERHKEDLYLTEVEVAASGLNYERLRLDGWAMPYSYAKHRTIGYEIKTNRSDFLADQKWHGYLPYVHEFYFVSPPKAIAKTELPPEVGLLHVCGSRLVCRKPAMRRQVEIPTRFWVYLMMKLSRAVSQEMSAAEWREWQATKRDNKRLGRAVAKDLARKYDDEVAQARDAIRRADAQEAKLKALLEGLGMTENQLTYATPETALRALLHRPENQERMQEEVRRILSSRLHEARRGADHAIEASTKLRNFVEGLLADVDVSPLPARRKTKERTPRRRNPKA